MKKEIIHETLRVADLDFALRGPRIDKLLFEWDEVNHALKVARKVIEDTASRYSKEEQFWPMIQYIDEVLIKYKKPSKPMKKVNMNAQVDLFTAPVEPAISTEVKEKPVVTAKVTEAKAADAKKKQNAILAIAKNIAKKYPHFSEINCLILAEKRYNQEGRK